MKKFNGKLKLNKKTIANLSPEDLVSFKGGSYTCPASRSCVTCESCLCGGSGGRCGFTTGGGGGGPSPATRGASCGTGCGGNTQVLCWDDPV